ncbi:hypothetical protein [Tepidimonas aquatica]|uniref:Uncharacterized protein n=1 Tax=Tepidimonas aquatica TaxID=247482 RepID=A0A554WVN6_9BURK|nr:hypothetical protein [Tepidimonas aquatica]TSE27638.1 hypothetical protein Taqua_00369 [Tepidimonas aquatica]
MSGLTPAPASTSPPRWRLRLLLWTAVLAACAAVFAWYLTPDFMLTVADRLWSCF